MAWSQDGGTQASKAKTPGPQLPRTDGASLQGRGPAATPLEPGWGCTPQGRAPLPALLRGCGLPSGSGLDSDSAEGPVGGSLASQAVPGRSPSLLGHELHRQGLLGPALLYPQAHSGEPHPLQGGAGRTPRDFCPSLTVRELGSCHQPLRHTWETPSLQSELPRPPCPVLPLCLSRFLSHTKPRPAWQRALGPPTVIGPYCVPGMCQLR